MKFPAAMFSCLLVLGLGGPVPVALASSSDSGTLTVGSKVMTCVPNTLGTYGNFGFISGSTGTGSYSPAVLTGGNTVARLYDNPVTGPCITAHSTLSISGFATNPGSGWLISVTCNGITNNAAAAASYSYAAPGTAATWTWSQTFGLTSGAMVSCTIVHN